MKEKWNNYKLSDMKFFENMKFEEYLAIFNKDFNEEIMNIQNNNDYFLNSPNKHLKTKEKNNKEIDNEEDFLKYLDQINDDEENKFKEENLEKLNKIGFDEDLCENLITYDSNFSSKVSKEKKTPSGKNFFSIFFLNIKFFSKKKLIWTTEKSCYFL